MWDCRVERQLPHICPNMAAASVELSETFPFSILLEKVRFTCCEELLDSGSRWRFDSKWFEESKLKAAKFHLFKWFFSKINNLTHTRTFLGEHGFEITSSTAQRWSKVSSPPAKTGCPTKLS